MVFYTLKDDDTGKMVKRKSLVGFPEFQEEENRITNRGEE
jgi:hypothetical protein